MKELFEQFSFFLLQFASVKTQRIVKKINQQPYGWYLFLIYSLTFIAFIFSLFLSSNDSKTHDRSLYNSNSYYGDFLTLQQALAFFVPRHTPIDLLTSNFSSVGIYKDNSNSYTNNDKISIKSEENVNKVNNSLWSEYSIYKRDNIIKIFKRLPLNSDQIKAIKKSVNFYNQIVPLQVGKKVKVLINSNNEIKSIQIPLSLTKVLMIVPASSGKWKTFTIERPLNKVLKYVEGKVGASSFLYAIRKMGIDSKIANKIINIFSWDGGFLRSLKRGDTYNILYETYYLDGKKIKDGDVVAVELIHNGNSFRAIRYTNPNGVTSYYTPQGMKLEEPFIRNPVSNSHITSLFSMGRYHPILHTIRAHQGVDFAAPFGTPIKSTGDGVVSFVGYNGGYGKVVIINHGSIYSTLYGHMSDFAKGLHVGSYVSKAQVIGYVGKTGLATGTHLHYEFRVNGVHHDPLTVKLPNTTPISPQYRGEFMKMAKNILYKLNMLRRTTKTI